MTHISLIGFNIVDLCVIFVIMLSGFIAYMRGFSWEMASLLYWVLTLVAVWFLSWTAGPWIGVLMKTSMGWTLPNFVTIAIAGLIIFLSMTLFLGPTTSRIMDATKNMRLGFIDRILGFCYGALRGFFVIAILFLVYTLFVPFDDRPSLISEARLHPWLNASASFLRDFLPQVNGTAI